MGREERRADNKKAKKNLRNAGMTRSQYEEFMQELNKKYYYDIVKQAYKDIYDVYKQQLLVAMRNNKIGQDRAEAILKEAYQNTGMQDFIYKSKILAKSE